MDWKKMSYGVATTNYFLQTINRINSSFLSFRCFPVDLKFVLLVLLEIFFKSYHFFLFLLLDLSQCFSSTCLSSIKLTTEPCITNFILISRIQNIEIWLCKSRLARVPSGLLNPNLVRIIVFWLNNLIYTYLLT